MTFSETKQPVLNRGSAPNSFLTELVAWVKSAPVAIFAPNTVPIEIYTIIKSSLARPFGADATGTPIYTWESMLQRRAAVCEVARVHAGLETSWNFGEGVDSTNQNSEEHRTGQETGIFQVSFDSELISHRFMEPFAAANAIQTVDAFIPKMKSDHALAFEYYFRLIRISIAWAGPLIRHGQNSIYPWLSRPAQEEFMRLLA